MDDPVVRGRLKLMEWCYLFNGRFSFFWVDSWINLRCRLWTIRLDELEMDYFPLLYQLPLCSKGRPGYCCEFNKISLFCEPRVAKLLVGQLCQSRFPKQSPRVNL